MSQRNSGYERKERDLYETPAWVTEALVPHLRPDLDIWEPACGSGKMVNALKAAGQYVIRATDISDKQDFLDFDDGDIGGVDAIITNPPYELAVPFIVHAVALMKPAGFVAMLLRTDFDHARGRTALFADCPAFAKKVVLTKRIKWFEDSTGSPSFNHAWFIWDWLHVGQPVLAYAPR